MADSETVSAREADFLFRVGDLTADDLKVTEFTGTEGISRLFQFQIGLCSEDAEIVPTEMLGKACSLEICSATGPRWVNGIVRRFERTGEGKNLTHYAVEIVPAHWLLTRRHKCRIFQSHTCSDMSVPGVIKKVFEDAGIPADSYRFALESTYEPQEYIVQYRESEMDFISRLMEGEGIFYFFEHTAAAHVMVIGDSGVAHVEFAKGAEVPFHDPSGLAPEQACIFGLRDSASIQFGATCLDDFNFKQPTMPLKSSTAAESFTALEFSDHPGEYVDRAIGDRLARLRLEEHQCARQVIHMAAVERGLLCGFKFSLIDHPSSNLNREYLVTHISHRATQSQSGQEEAVGSQVGTRHELDVRCIHSDVPFRPPRVTPRPTVLGSQTARVVGPSGEEIYTDKYGRVKVKFHWDLEGKHDEHASCWIRVSQGMAGGNYGIMFLPRVGQEVVVDFLEGNPDQPLIIGRVYNNDHMPPYTLPDEKTKSVIKTHSSKGGGGNNEIRFEDLKGKEQLFLQAQRQMDTRVKASHMHTIGGSYHLHVGGGKDGELHGEYRQLVHKAKHTRVKGEQRTWIEKNDTLGILGTRTVAVVGTMSVDVGKDVVYAFGAGHKHDVRMTYALKASRVKIEASTGIELKCGGSSIVLTPAAIFIKSRQVKINSGSGPPVTEPRAARMVPIWPEAPAVADSSEPGQDTNYGGPADEAARLETEPAAPPPEPGRAADQLEKTWVQIELVDEADQPCAGESYELELPDGKIRRGSLDANGRARIEHLEPGSVKLRFPNLDSAAWERIQ